MTAPRPTPGQVLASEWFRRKWIRSKPMRPGAPHLTVSITGRQTNFGIDLKNPFYFVACSLLILIAPCCAKLISHGEKTVVQAENIDVRVDVAGMYYARQVSVSKGSTILEAMQAVQDADTKDADNGENEPRLKFRTELDSKGHEQIDGITIEHVTPAKSRQGGKRSYPAGRYEYFDDTVEVKADGGFTPGDPCKRYVLAWQYYVYDLEGRDRDRAELNSERVVVPFSKQTLDESCLVVWRLVAIFMKPYGDSLKVVASRTR